MLGLGLSILSCTSELNISSILDDTRAAVHKLWDQIPLYL